MSQSVAREPGSETSTLLRFGSQHIPHLPGGLKLLEPLAGRVLAFDELNRHYRQAQRQGGAGTFADRAMESLDVRYEAAQEQVERIPRTGPLVVVANHPFGAVDGLVLSSLLHRVRPDVRLMVNYMLEAIPEMWPECFFVDPFGGQGSVGRNLGVMRKALRWVKDGGALCVFPAGEVSRLELSSGSVLDAPWSTTVARMIRQTKAAVTPIYFEGRNRAVFQIAGLIHPRMRTGLLPREMLARRGSTIRLVVGNRISPGKVEGFPCDESLTHYLRSRVHVMGLSKGAAARREGNTGTAEPVAKACQSPERVQAEVAGLPADRTLARVGSMRVVWAQAGEIPATLRELGRLRELTFRAVGEGTGKSLDLDRFDSHYLHLFVWHDDRGEVVGAYRMALTGSLDRGQRSAKPGETGLTGLYTRTLFKFGNGLLDEMGPAIELGRSFVREEYQKQFVPLGLLWSGIMRFAAQHPDHKCVFGPVSISNDYSPASKHLMAAFLKMNNSLPSLMRKVAARNPMPVAAGRDWDWSVRSKPAKSLDELDDLVREIERDGRGVPVLIRQYLRLNAKVIGFNVDPDFGDVLDALIVTDLTKIDKAVLLRHMGQDLVPGFMDYQEKKGRGSMVQSRESSGSEGMDTQTSRGAWHA
jgi:putative hemolysin